MAALLKRNWKITNNTKTFVSLIPASAFSYTYIETPLREKIKETRIQFK